MDIKEFLGRALQLDELINSHVAELNQYRQLAMSIGGSRLEEHISRSVPSDAPFAKWVDRIVDKEKELNGEIDRLVAIKLEISDFIDRIDNPQWQCLLRSRYVMCHSWTDVAAEMNYGISSVYRIHKNIMDALEDNFKDSSQ